jgi:hypothetical protein
MEKLLLFGALSFSIISHSQEFQKVYGENLTDSPRDMIVTSANDLLIVGQTEDGTNELNGLMMKVDTSGNVLWSKSFGEPNTQDYLAAVIEDNGYYYAVGGTRSFSVDTTSDVFVIKTDLSGSIIWTKKYGGTGETGGYTGDYATSIIKESNNQFLVAGTWASSETNKLRGGYLIRIDDSGNMLNEFIVDGGAASEWFSKVNVAQNGDILVSGTNKLSNSWQPWFYRMTNTGTMLVSQGYGTAGTGSQFGSSILEINNETYQISNKGAEVMLTRLNANGDTLGLMLYGDSLSVNVPSTSLEKSQDGNLFLLAELNHKGVVAKLNLSGDTLWVNYLENNTGTYTKLVELDGYFYVVGSSSTNTNGEEDIYLVKMKNDGTSELCISDTHDTFYYYNGDCVITSFPDPVTSAGTESTITANSSNLSLNDCEICILPSFSYVVTDQTVEFTNETNVDVDYLWDFGDGNTSSNESPTYTYTSYGSFTICLTSSDACSGDSVCQVIDIIDYTGLEELNIGEKELIKIVDLMGREVPFEKNKVLIYVYSDGTTQRVFEFE